MFAHRYISDKINTGIDSLKNIYYNIALKVNVHDKTRIKYTMNSSIEALMTRNTEVSHSACMVVCAQIFNVCIYIILCYHMS